MERPRLKGMPASLKHAGLTPARSKRGAGDDAVAADPTLPDPVRPNRMPSRNADRRLCPFLTGAAVAAVADASPERDRP